MKRNGLSRAHVIIGLVAVLVLLCLSGSLIPFELVYWLAVGWTLFLARAFANMEPDWNTVVTGLAALAAFTLGLHLFLGWLARAIRFAKSGNTAYADETRSTGRNWHKRWTIAIVAIIATMFVAGISAIGIAHQVAWLATTKEPLYTGLRNVVYRMQSQAHLRQIGVALQSYDDQWKVFPPGASIAPSGKAMHSWQTQILPYSDHQSLYDQIDLDSPWTAAVQKKPFATKIPHYLMTYRYLPESDAHGNALSHYAANQYALGGAKSKSLKDFSDGASNTVICGEARGNYKAWGDPTNWRDPSLGINKSDAGFGSPSPPGAQFVFADGHTAFLSEKIDPKVLRALATPSGNEPIPDDY